VFLCLEPLSSLLLTADGALFRPYLLYRHPRRPGRQVEKTNDLLVARRQKNRGMQWSEATSDALAALRTLLLNGGWDRYWQQQDVLPILAS
jgi:hypothetical protein